MSYDKDATKKVVVYLGVMMAKWQDEADTIYAPYHKSNLNLLLQYTFAPIMAKNGI
jgi:hypothetical protein